VDDRFELRLVSELTSVRTRDNVASGLLPLTVGFKINIAEEIGFTPTMAFIGHLSIPRCASESFQATYFAPSFRFAMQHTIGEGIALGYNLGAGWDGETAEPVFLYSLTGGMSLSDVLGFYIESYGFAPQDRAADHRLDGGFAYQLKPNIQVDISGGIGFTSNAPQGLPCSRILD
jgi:hypothetical protein